MSRSALARLDLNALRHNLRRVKHYAPHSSVLAVIKANGYGHGMITVAKTLEAAGADGFGVASIKEAIALRAAGITNTIVLLEGCFDSDELALVEQYRLEMVVHQARQLEWLEQYCAQRPIRVWLKIDTGMHRLGVPPDAVRDVYARLRRCAAVADDICLMTHLANADVPEHPQNQRQLSQFAESCAGLAGSRSIANSAALIALEHSRGDWVRPGIMLYGVSPFDRGSGADLDLKPVMTLCSELFAMRHCKQGEAVGYGGTYVCPEDMPIGIVSIGYGDGYPRHAPTGTPVLINGARVPLVGRVSMDMICVDLRSAPQARLGDSVVLWGAGLPVEEIAQAAGTIAYELLCGVTSRVDFAYRED
ncbi:MAG: alanine racemase [Pseudomonadota bacterium]